MQFQLLGVRVTGTSITMATIVIAIISAAIETDIFVPSLPTVQHYFATSESMVQMLLTVNFVGLCLASLLYGPLSDAYGRRPILLLGLSIYFIGSIGCIFSQSIFTLLIFRFIQGAGAATVFVVPGAVVFDLYTQDEAAKFLGYISSIITSVMAAAPIIGGKIHLNFGWRANFIVLVVFATLSWLLVYAFMQETHTERRHTQFSLEQVFKNYIILLFDAKVQRSAIIICAGISAYFVYIANLSLIFINTLGVSHDAFGYYQATVLLMFSGVSLSNKHIISALGPVPVRKLGMSLSLIGAVGLGVVTIFEPESAFLITLTMCLYAIGLALYISLVFGDYMSVYPEIKGAASALCNAQRMVSMSTMISFSSLFYTGNILPVAVIIALLSAIATVAHWLQLNH